MLPRPTQHVALANRDAVDEGTIAVQLNRQRDIRILIDFTSPERQIYFIGGGKGQIYTPKTNEVQQGDLGKYRGVEPRP